VRRRERTTGVSAKTGTAPTRPRARNLLLTGGFGHPFDTAAPALAALLAAGGIDSRVSDDIEGALAMLAAEPLDLLTVYALRWTMSTGDKYAPHRERWGFSLSPRGRAAIEGHLARGGGLLALHTALICFDDWPAWKDMLGAVWAWGRSGHPPRGDVDVRPCVSAHPLLGDVPAFTLHDEVYGNLDGDAHAGALLQARARAAAEWHPVLWTRRHGPARVVVDALGHDASAFTHPVHGAIVARAARWAAGLDLESASLDPARSDA